MFGAENKEILFAFIVKHLCACAGVKKGGNAPAVDGGIKPDPKSTTFTCV